MIPLEDWKGLKYLVRSASADRTKPQLMLLIHGYGSNEEDLFSFAGELPEDLFIISVRGLHPTTMGGYSWYDINFTDMQKFNNVKQANESLNKLKDFIDFSIDNYNLDPEKVWLCGFSQGAILSFAMALNYPEKIKNILCLSGYPAPDIIGEVSAKGFSHLDFFISHGTEDVVIPVDWAKKGDQLLSQLNISHEYHEYRSGHGIAPQNFYDLLNWVKERV